MSTSPELIGIQDTVRVATISATETRNLQDVFDGDEGNDSPDNECLFTSVHEHLVEILQEVKTLKEAAKTCKKDEPVTRGEFNAAIAKLKLMEKGLEEGRKDINFNSTLILLLMAFVGYLWCKMS